MGGGERLVHHHPQPAAGHQEDRALQHPSQFSYREPQEAPVRVVPRPLDQHQLLLRGELPEPFHYRPFQILPAAVLDQGGVVVDQ